MKNKTKWPNEVLSLFSLVENGSALPAAQQEKIRYHINRLWLDKEPQEVILNDANLITKAMEICAR